ALVVLRQDRARRRERVIAELPGRRLEVRPHLIHLQRRQRIVAAARRLEHIAAVNLAALQVAGLARPPDLVLRATIERLEPGIAHGPVDDRAILRDGGRAVALDGLRANPEIILVEAPRHGAVVHRAAAGLVAVAETLDPRRPRVRVGPPGDRLTLHVRAQVLALEVAQLVLRSEVRSLEPRAALEPDPLHPGLAGVGGENSAARADADDHDIRLFGCHGSSPALGGLPLQADERAAGEGVLALHVGRRERRMGAGEADEPPAGEVLVAAI